MAKHTTLRCSLAVVLTSAFCFFYLACNNHHHSNGCSNELPIADYSDTLHLFQASALMLNDSNAGMQLIPGGTFLMGAAPNDSFANPDEYPAHLVHINSFWIDATEVTNRQFREFVKATGYQTTAERAQPKGALVFNAENNHHSNLYWWKFIPSADWQHPFGPGSNIDTLDNYPVVQVSWFDAMAYASWAGKRLPTEAEWEYAARAGLTESLYPWGNQSPELNNMANVFQGSFPEKNTAADGFLFTSPVKTFPPNAYGLFDVSGNVWEWCADKYHSEYYKYCSENAIQSPTGPAQSFSPENRYEELRVIRGGSFLCNQSYCTGYRVSARNKTTPSTSLLNVGFRCVRDIPHK